MTTDSKKILSADFDNHRAHLHAVAWRILGSSAEADDAVQEAWLRLHRTDETIGNLGGWLTTVVARVCLDVLRARRARGEKPLEDAPEPTTGSDPEKEALLADAVGPALLVVLDTLEPAERLAFVLHDMFAVPFEEIAPIVGRTPEAARQLASRGRRRVGGAEHINEATIARRREVVTAFLAASRNSDFGALLAVLDPNVVARGDAEVAARGHAPAETRGADAVAKMFLGRARAARAALVDGEVGATFVVDGQPRFALAIEWRGDRIIAIQAFAAPENLEGMLVELFD